MDAFSLALASGGVVYSTRVRTLPVSVSTSRINALWYQCHSSVGFFKNDFRCLPPRTYKLAMCCSKITRLSEFFGPVREGYAGRHELPGVLQQSYPSHGMWKACVETGVLN